MDAWPEAERDDSEEWEEIKRERMAAVREGISGPVLKALGYRPITTADGKAFDGALQAVLAAGGWPVLVASPKTLLEMGRLPLEMYEFKPEGAEHSIPIIVKADALEGEFVLMDARRMPLSAVHRAIVEKARREDARSQPEPEGADDASP